MQDKGVRKPHLYNPIGLPKLLQKHMIGEIMKKNGYGWKKKGLQVTARHAYR